MSTTATQSAPVTQAPVQYGQMGKGRYSALGEQIFSDAQLIIGLSEKDADKLAKAYISELGRLQMTPEKIKLGKPNKDGNMSLGETSKVKTVATPAMSIALLVQELSAIRKLGVITFGQVKLSARLTEWLAE